MAKKKQNGGGRELPTAYKLLVVQERMKGKHAYGVFVGKRAAPVAELFRAYVEAHEPERSVLKQIVLRGWQSSCDNRPALTGDSESLSYDVSILERLPMLPEYIDCYNVTLEDWTRVKYQSGAWRRQNE